MCENYGFPGGCSTFTDTTHRNDSLINMSQTPAQILVITAVFGRLEARRNHHEASLGTALRMDKDHARTHSITKAIHITYMIYMMVLITSQHFVAITVLALSKLYDRLRNFQQEVQRTYSGNHEATRFPCGRWVCFAACLLACLVLCPFPRIDLRQFRI